MPSELALAYADFFEYLWSFVWRCPADRVSPPRASDERSAGSSCAYSDRLLVSQAGVSGNCALFSNISVIGANSDSFSQKGTERRNNFRDKLAELTLEADRRVSSLLCEQREYFGPRIERVAKAEVGARARGRAGPDC